MPRIRNAFVASYGYRANIPDPANPGATIPNPENVNQFVQRKIREYVKEVTKAHEINTDVETTRQTSATKAETEINLS